MYIEFFPSADKLVEGEQLIMQVNLYDGLSILDQLRVLKSNSRAVIRQSMYSGNP